MDDIATCAAALRPSLAARLLRPELFLRPARVADPAWLYHAPFAFWLTAVLRPARIVEVATSPALSAQPAAWLQRPRQLLQVEPASPLDPAIEDRSIDLLHIGGDAAADGVAGAWPAWRAKLSDGAVLLLHGTQAGGGAARFWAEQRACAPAFELPHGRGLGVLGLGETPAEPVRWLLDLAAEDPEAAGEAASLFDALGRAAHLRDGEAQLVRELAEARHQAVLGVVRQSRARHAAAAARLRRDGVAAELAQVEQQSAEADRQARTALGKALASAAEAQAAAAEAQAAAAAALAKLEASRAAAATEAAALAGQIEAIRRSRSWRITRPLRAVSAGMAAAARLLRGPTAPAGPMPAALAPEQPPPGSESSVAMPEPAAPLPAAGSPDARELLAEAARAELRALLAGGDRISFPAAAHPDISVLIVLWNQSHLTLRCLRALQREAAGPATPSLEIVVVDNASSDETASLLARLDGAVIVRNPGNVGFLRACNQAADLARGRALLLLNNDAFVHPGALAAALATLDRGADVGAVGARLILPSGGVQEAGGIIWSDGSTFHYGRDADPQAGEVMFRREVDYCSGAFLMTPTAVWRRLGGFDARYEPAYCEDADYCMRLRASGLRVLYEPAAAADHFERDSEARQGDADAATRRNRQRFAEHHAAALGTRHLAPQEANLLAARNRADRGRRRLLVLDNEVPLRALGAGFPRMSAILGEAAAAGWSVTFYPVQTPTVDWATARAEIPSEIELVPNRGLLGLAGFLAERRGHHDVVLASRPENMAALRAALRRRPDLLDGAALVYDAEAIFAARTIARRAAEGRPIPPGEGEAMIAAELALAEGADAVVCVTEAEAAAFRARLGGPVRVLSHPTVVRRASPGFQDRSGFLFVGRLLEPDSPNWQGLAWFVRAAWPLIRAALPDARLVVAGHLAAAHEVLAPPGVDLLGPVPDLGPLYDAARVFIAPVRFAAGVPIKILEAAAAGLPVVGTRLMAAQLGWTDGTAMAAADAPSELAAAAVSLHRDEARWRALRATAWDRVGREHGAGRFRTRFRGLLEDAALVRASD